VRTISLNKEIEQFLRERGAIRVGFANQQTLAGVPDITDITYKLPEAKSAISFAMPLDKKLIRAYLAKKLPNGRSNFEKHMFDLYIRIWRIEKELVVLLQKKGFKGAAFFPNNKFREDIPGWRLKVVPELCLRYVAVASGVGSFGWSGNVGIKDYGTTILLGAVVTDAVLEPSDPIPEEESFCNDCKLCARVCPLKMFSDKEAFTFKMGGREYSYAKRIDIRRCIIGCMGLTGLHHSGKFSTWSPGRFEYPEDEDEVTRLLVHSSMTKGKWPQIPDGSKGFNVSVDLGYDIQISCGNCSNICFGDPKETAKNYKILTNSGCVIQKENGEILILPPEEAEKVFQSMDPKHMRLYDYNYKRGLKKRKRN